MGIHLEEAEKQDRISAFSLNPLVWMKIEIPIEVCHR